MIQRIQSIHLFLSAVLGIIAVVMNLCAGQDSLAVKVFETPMEFVRYIYIALLGTAAIVATVSIFKYGNRLRQMKLVKFCTLLYIVSCVGFAVCYFISDVTTCPTSVSPFLPLVAIAFNIMAQRRIQYDENLVRSADRLR